MLEFLKPFEISGIYESKVDKMRLEYFKFCKLLYFVTQLQLQHQTGRGSSYNMGGQVLTTPNVSRF